MVNKDTFTGPSFSISNRIHRLIWSMVYSLFFRSSPRICHGWRAFLLRAFGAKIGKGVHVYPKVQIWAPWNLEIADEAGIADGAILYCQGKIRIGKRAVISQGVHICTGSHDYESDGMPLITKDIIIGDYAWVTAEAFIHPGVTVGSGTVIGARSVVTRDMTEWTVCAGQPCKPLKPRNWRPNHLS